MLFPTATQRTERTAFGAAIDTPLAESPEPSPIAVDANGSPVTLEAATWFVCFVPGLRRQWWHAFADSRHKHVFALRPLEDGTWLLMEPWWSRMMVNVLTLEQAITFLRWGGMGDVLKVRERIPGHGSQMRGWANCSVLVSYMLGRSYWTWTPNGLYRRLAGEADVEQVDVAGFLRRHVLSESQRHSRAALAWMPKQRDAALRDILLQLGTALVATMTSRSGIGLHRAAVSEVVRDPAVAGAYRSAAPEQAIEKARKVLASARWRGEIDVDDCALAARRFIAMLKGHLHMELVLGLREPPSYSEIRDHVACAVDVFLRGVHRPRPGRTHPAPVPSPHPAEVPAQGLIREIGESVRELSREDDWDAVAGLAEALWSDYVGCTGLTWQQASARFRRAWDPSHAGGDPGDDDRAREPFRFGACGETSC